MIVNIELGLDLELLTASLLYCNYIFMFKFQPNDHRHIICIYHIQASHNFIFHIELNHIYVHI